MGDAFSPHEARALAVLADHYHSDADCRYFRDVAEETGLTVRQSKRAVRSLARKGFAEYVRGLFDDDGMVAGSGYRCTPEGKELADTMTAPMRADRRGGWDE